MAAARHWRYTGRIAPKGDIRASTIERAIQALDALPGGAAYMELGVIVFTFEFRHPNEDTAGSRADELVHRLLEEAGMYGGWDWSWEQTPVLTWTPP